MTGAAWWFVLWNFKLPVMHPVSVLFSFKSRTVDCSELWVSHDVFSSFPFFSGFYWSHQVTSGHIRKSQCSRLAVFSSIVLNSWWCRAIYGRNKRHKGWFGNKHEGPQKTHQHVPLKQWWSFPLQMTKMTKVIQNLFPYLGPKSGSRSNSFPTRATVATSC